MANKKIVVLKLRELIYTAIFLFFGIVLILLLVAMFSGKKAGSGKNSDAGQAGSIPSESGTGTSGSSAGQAAQGSAAATGTSTEPGQPSRESDGTGQQNGTNQNGSSFADSDLTQTFRPGVYTADFTLAGNTLTLELIVDPGRVKSVSLRSLASAAADGEGGEGDEFIATMYPLMDPALAIIESNLAEGTALSDITFSVENQYTGTLLVSAIGQLLNKAYR